MMRGPRCLRPLDVFLRALVVMDGVEKHHRRRRAAIGPVELALVHRHALDVPRLHQVVQHRCGQRFVHLLRHAPGIPTVEIDGDDLLLGRLGQRHRGRGDAQQRADLDDRARILARLAHQPLDERNPLSLDRGLLRVEAVEAGAVAGEIRLRRLRSAATAVGGATALVAGPCEPSARCDKRRIGRATSRHSLRAMRAGAADDGDGARSSRHVGSRSERTC